MNATQKLTANNKFSKKLTFKRKQNKDLAEQIHDYFTELGLRLPKQKQVFKHNPDKYIGDMLDEDTGEVFDFRQHYELANAYYQLRQSNKAVYALFKKGHAVKQQILGCWYSKHRLDHVWLYRKSRLIRKMWRQFLGETELYKHYEAKHLVLTVPHQGGQWKGKNFYARELIAHFNLLRKNPNWKRCIYAGEYGVEISKAPDSKNGLHIHLHCMVFQHKNVSGKGVADMIKKEWEKLTGAKTIHYESLYIHKKDESGKWIMDEREAVDYYTDTDTGIDAWLNPEIDHYTESNVRGVEHTPAKQFRKKFYLNQSWIQELTPEEQKETFVVGILEAIKYHFKNDTLKNGDGTYNVELISEVLENSKYLRMYSKFGGFYGEKRLNYSDVEKTEEVDPLTLEPDMTEEQEYEMLVKMAKNGILPSEDDEPDFLEPSDAWKEGPPDDPGRLIDLEYAEKNLINPFTREPAGRSEYERYLALPEKMMHQSAYLKTPNAPITQKQFHYFKIWPGHSLGEIMKLIATGRYGELFEYEEHEKFNQYMYQFQLN